MSNEMFLGVLAALAVGLFSWGFRTLPQEGWQIAAAVPIAKDGHGHWHGVNLTYYGVFQASAYTLGLAMMIVLLGAVGVSLLGAAALATLLLACCVPASSLVARLVERKRATFTVAGAVFVGALLGPWVFLLGNRLLQHALGASVPVVPALAAAASGYALGEGVGRLACVSFGCCYGKPLASLSPRLRALFARAAFVFAGPTKKVAYEGGLEGTPVVPIQAITATLFVGIALVAAAAFLRGRYGLAFGLAFIGTQVWRTVSEVLRADYRGGGRISAYQMMALLGMLYVAAVYPFLPVEALPPAHVLDGLQRLWDPVAIVCLQALWITIFLRTGRSVVTEATLSFRVRRDLI